MNLISIKTHGYFDYFYVVAYAVAPTLFDFSGRPAVMAYTSSAAYLLGSGSTNYPLGLIKLIPFRVHMKVEYTYSLLTVALPWLLGFASVLTARYFFIAMGLLALTVGLLTEKRDSGTTAAQ